MTYKLGLPGFTSVYIMLLFSLDIVAQEPVAFSKKTLPIEKRVRLGNTEIALQLRNVPRAIDPMSVGDETSGRLKIVELSIRHLDENKPQKRIWWMATVAPGKGTVEGETIYDVVTTVHNENELIVLAVANTYYASASLILIDPKREISTLPEISTASAGGSVNPPLAAESQLERIQVPLELRGNMYGSKDINLSGVGKNIMLAVTRMDGSNVNLQFDMETKTWLKL